MAGRDGAPWVVVHERLDRPLRLGPFSSGREALKFVLAAAVGAVVSLAIAPWAGVPIVATGALVSLWRPDGEGLDERLATFARWTLRRPGGAGTMTGPSSAGASTVALPDGRRAGLLRASGVPLAFLPPAELAAQFERFRELLRSVDGGLILVAATAPIHAGSVLPPPDAVGEYELGARDGYQELVGLLARRRSVRTVLVALARPASGTEELRRLEEAVDLLQGRLADLGLRSERLRGRPLCDALVRLGLRAQEKAP